MSTKSSLGQYTEHAQMLTQEFEGISAAGHLASVMDLFPASPAKIADIGAGSGRDATWLGDSLPDLSALRGYSPFDVILLSGVWHHVAPEDRNAAMMASTEILAPEGLVVIALRQGPTVPARGLYDSLADDTTKLAQQTGFEAIALRAGQAEQWDSQSSGVLGSWLILHKG